MAGVEDISGGKRRKKTKTKRRFNLEEDLDLMAGVEDISGGKRRRRRRRRKI